jgi:hypothetical protein
LADIFFSLFSSVLHTLTLSYIYYDYGSNLENTRVNVKRVEQQVFDPFESEENHDEKTPNKIGQPWEMKMSESDKMEQKQRENEEIEIRWRQEQEAEERFRERQRRETDRRHRGSVEFVHPDLKNELKKQGEDPNNPWVWLTSYSRIPVSFNIYQ